MRESPRLDVAQVARDCVLRQRLARRELFLPILQGGQAAGIRRGIERPATVVQALQRWGPRGVVSAGGECEVASARAAAPACEASGRSLRRAPARSPGRSCRRARPSAGPQGRGRRGRRRTCRVGPTTSDSATSVQQPPSSHSVKGLLRDAKARLKMPRLWAIIVPSTSRTCGVRCDSSGAGAWGQRRARPPLASVTRTNRRDPTEHDCAVKVHKARRLTRTGSDWKGIFGFSAGQSSFFSLTSSKGIPPIARASRIGSARPLRRCRRPSVGYDPG